MFDESERDPTDELRLRSDTVAQLDDEDRSIIRSASTPSHRVTKRAASPTPAERVHDGPTGSQPIKPSVTRLPEEVGVPVILVLVAAEHRDPELDHCP